MSLQPHFTSPMPLQPANSPTYPAQVPRYKNPDPGMHIGPLRGLQTKIPGYAAPVISHIDAALSFILVTSSGWSSHATRNLPWTVLVHLYRKLHPKNRETELGFHRNAHITYVSSSWKFGLKPGSEHEKWKLRITFTWISCQNHMPVGIYLESSMHSHETKAEVMIHCSPVPEPTATLTHI